MVGSAKNANATIGFVASVPSERIGQRMTDEEWCAMEEDDEGELVDGVLVEEEMPDYAHDTLVMWLGHLLLSWMGDRLGAVAASDAKFVVKAGRGRKPDLSVFLPGGPMPPRRGAVRVPPDIMVEVISRESRDVRRDRVDKMNDYAQFGVRWYWLIDPEARTFEVFRREDEGIYARVIGASAGVIADVPGCAGLSIDLDAMWRRIEALPE